jgi:signal transduction histidine kinase
VSSQPRRRTLLAKLLAAFMAPTLVLFALFAWYAYVLEKHDLERALGERLEAIAASTAPQIRAKYLLAMDPNEPTPRAWQNVRRRLDAARVATGAHRILVFSLDGRTLCDTESDTFGTPVHELALDRAEIDRAVQGGRAISSVAFKGTDGEWYKAGYAPVAAADDDATIVAGVRVEAPARFFATLDVLRDRLLIYGAGLTGVVIAASLGFAVFINRRLRRLALATEEIARGDLTAKIDVGGADELAQLAWTLDHMREALRARDERLQMMLAGIAHEVRNPLGGIELFAGILRDELGSDTEKLGHVAKIERELGYLKNIVNDFLEFARRAKPDLKPTDVAGLCTELRDVIASDAAAAGTTIEVAAPAPAVAAADEAQLRRAVLNLLRNAVQAAPGGKITLGAHADGDHITISVADTGKGIAPTDLDKIFAPFFTTKEKGTGLGLAFVKEIVGDHRGKLDVQSSPGKGTTFTIELPRA